MQLGDIGAFEREDAEFFGPVGGVLLRNTGQDLRGVFRCNRLDLESILILQSPGTCLLLPEFILGHWLHVSDFTCSSEVSPHYRVSSVATGFPFLLSLDPL